MTDLPSVLAPSSEVPRPEVIDVYGLTHPGRVRSENQDQFLIASLHKVMQVHHSSLPPEHLGRLTSDSRGFVFLVADGVGGREGGKIASGTALQAIADYVTHAMDLNVKLDPTTESSFLEQLKTSVERGHEKIRTSGDGTGMATTLTMVAVRWPRAYMVHVGDSRCYRLRQKRLDRMTHDQTMAQALLEAGALTPNSAERSDLKHVLYSALGGREAQIETVTEDIQLGDVMLLCSDGLTKHVSDTEIRDLLDRDVNAEAMCTDLVKLALERGGTDNVTVVIGRTAEAGRRVDG